MKSISQLKKRLTQILYLLIFSPFIFLISNCSTSELRISEFEFEYNNKEYIIRSAYCPGNPESCNQIIGDDIVAVDLNQDRIIDKIIRGNQTLAEAQQIYNYCLSTLEKHNKLNKIDSRLNGYYVVEGDKEFEVRTMNSGLKTDFNEFKIIEKKGWGESLVISVYVDKNSNGQLDEKIMGDISIDEAQKFYSKILKRGLSERELVKADSIITVR